MPKNRRPEPSWPSGSWPRHSWIVSEPYAGLQAQALGLAEAGGFSPDIIELKARSPWALLPARWRSAPLDAIEGGWPATRSSGLVFSVGGAGAAVGAALRRRGSIAVQIQNPRMGLRRFDLVVANTHDELSGHNVIVARTALHRATASRLAEARSAWMPRLAWLPRPLVAVLVGGSNGRLRLGAPEAALLARDLGDMIRRDRVGMALTPSRRTPAEMREILARSLSPQGAWVWDMTGDNPYFGLLACADVIVVTADSVSMVSEAVATTAPVLLAELPGRSRRIDIFLRSLLALGRIRLFSGRMETWPVQPLDDTAAVAAEMRRRLGF